MLIPVVDRMSNALEDATLMKRVQGWLVVFFVALIPISIATGWINSVAYVSALSLWALVASHGAWWAAASVEVKQDEAEELERIEAKVDKIAEDE